MSVFDKSDDSDSVPSKPQPNQHTPRSWSDWQQLRKSNPHQYYKPNVQARLMSDRAKLGDAFWTTDKPKDWWNE